MNFRYFIRENNIWRQTSQATWAHTCRQNSAELNRKESDSSPAPKK